MSLEITILTPPFSLAEGPHWDEKTQALYFVDIYASTVHKYVPENDQHTYAKVRKYRNSSLSNTRNSSSKSINTMRTTCLLDIPGETEKPVSLIIPVKDEPNKFVITYGTDVVLITWDGENSVSEYQVLASLENELPNQRFNDGKTSPSGVLFAGELNF